MRRLRGADASFLYKESRTQHLHTLKIIILDPVADEPPPDFHRFKQAFDRGVAVIPPFHWRLVTTPFRLAHPSWAYQRRLDVDYHIRRMTVPSPGGEREFAEVVSEIASTGLERDRPLWQLWYVDGLSGGRIAYVNKLHHAVADGLSSAQLLIDAASSTPTAPERPDHPWAGDEPIPTRGRLALDGAAYLARLVAGFPRMMQRQLRSWKISLERIRSGKPRNAVPFTAPPTRFTQRKLTPHRWFASVDLPLADLKRVKDALGGTLNDAFVACCAGSIRRYLRDHGELPEEALLASIPVSLRTPEEKRSYGNRTAGWMVSIATDIEDPAERFAAIRDHLAGARESSEARDKELLFDWQDYWWVYRYAIDGFGVIGSWLTGRPLFHTIISNVRGPQEAIYIGGKRVSGLRSMGPLLNGAGLNFTGWSYAGTMSVGIVVCREQVPDVWALADGVRDSLEELLAAAEKAELPASSPVAEISERQRPA